MILKEIQISYLQNSNKENMIKYKTQPWKKIMYEISAFVQNRKTDAHFQKNVYNLDQLG